MKRYYIVWKYVDIDKSSVGNWLWHYAYMRKYVIDDEHDVFYWTFNINEARVFNYKLYAKWYMWSRKRTAHMCILSEQELVLKLL
jgi:hypothetical protein